MATKASEYKATAAFFGLTTLLYKKAIANRTERAQGRLMSEHSRFQLLPIDAGSRS
jgi:hypothetical protein